MNEQLIALLVQALTQTQAQPVQGAQVQQPAGMNVPLPTGMQTQPVPVGSQVPVQNAQVPVQNSTAQPVPNPLDALVAGVASPAQPANGDAPAVPTAVGAQTFTAEQVMQMMTAVMNPAGNAGGANAPEQVASPQNQPVQGQTAQPAQGQPAVSLANLFAGVNQGQPAMTMEQVATMTPDQINQNWEQVSVALDSITKQ